MDNFKELFSMFSSIYEGLTNKKLKYNDFMDIFPKLVIIRKNMPVEGIELIVLIDELISFKEKNLLGLINDETVSLTKGLFLGQHLFGNIIVLSPIEIIKHLLLPYRINICNNEKETYLHISGFEFMFSFLVLFVGKTNIHYQEIIRKYNHELYELLIHYYLCLDKLDKTNDTKLGSAIINMFSVFYFKQDEYNNDYIFLDSIVNNAIENKREFIEYCETEGIKEVYLLPEDFKNTYAGIIKYMDESYKVKRNKK